MVTTVGFLMVDFFIIFQTDRGFRSAITMLHDLRVLYKQMQVGVSNCRYTGLKIRLKSGARACIVFWARFTENSGTLKRITLNSQSAKDYEKRSNLGGISQGKPDQKSITDWLCKKPANTRERKTRQETGLCTHACREDKINIETFEVCKFLSTRTLYPSVFVQILSPKRDIKSTTSPFG